MVKMEDVAVFISAIEQNNEYLQKILTEHKVKEPYDSDVPDIDQSSEECEDDNIKTEPMLNDMPFGKRPVITESEKKLVRYSTQAQPSQCEVCFETFTTKKRLLEHQRENPSCKIRKFKCDNCEKSFFNKFKLNVHMRIHTKESPYECKICLKKFRHAPNLKRHDDIVHKGIKPFKCDTCGKGM